jgi:hypothetical protein
MWVSPVADDPIVASWWRRAAEREEAERRAAERRAAAADRLERIERLAARAHEVHMAAAGALAASRWERIQRRRDQRDARWHGGYQVGSWGAGPVADGGVEARSVGAVEYGPPGRILSVR